MKRIIVLAFIVIGATAAGSFGLEVAKGTMKTISPCPFKIAAVAANFRMGFLYSLDVSVDGSVSKVKELSNSQRGLSAKFVHDELFVECMKTWHLEPAGRYLVSFYVGTTSTGTTSKPRDYMLITDPNSDKLKIELFISDSQTLKIETTTKPAKSKPKH